MRKRELIIVDLPKPDSPEIEEKKKNNKFFFFFNINQRRFKTMAIRKKMFSD